MKNLSVTRVLGSVLGLSLLASTAFADGSGNSALDILRSGLLGAGTGAISAGASGGNVGKGALIGAGTNVIGGALLDLFTGGSSQPAAVSYVQPSYYSVPVQTAPVYTPVYYPAQRVYPVQRVAVRRHPVVYRPEPVYVRQPVYTQPTYAYGTSRNDGNRQILRSGLLGAGVGAISASASGGKAGKGALIGAGTNVIGGALLDFLSGN